jgi:hypothetical protein
MKIYPNRLSVQLKDQINLNTDVQLAYVDTTSSTYKLETKIEEDYNKKSKTEVLPYDIVNTNLSLFDKNGELIPYESMIQDFVKDGKDYIYMPKNNSIKFIPKHFEYYIKAKKNIKYQSNNIYNINTYINNKLIANLLIQIFGDAKDRGLAPNNILINSGDLSLNKLLNINVNESDISFYLFKDFNTVLDSNDNPMEFNKKYYLDEYNTTMFHIIKNDSAIKDYEGIEYSNNKINLLMSNVNNSYKINTNILYSDYINCRYYFNIPTNTINTKYYSLFNDKNKTPILIEENLGSNLIIYITEELINDVKKYYKAIYEAIIYAYLNGYKKSDIYTSWITDTIPDYIVENNKLLKKNKFVSQLTPSEMLNIQNNSYKYLQVFIDSEEYPYVIYDGLYNNHLSFKKNKGINNEFSDPQIKPENWISIYCNDSIFFYKDFVYKINDNLEDCIFINIDNNKLIINTDIFRNSDNGIYIFNTKDITIDLNNIIEETYYLIVNSLMQFEVVKKDEYKNGKILMTINISQDKENTKNNILDMRIRGGGLLEDEKDNFDCFDIGNIYGRPYRKGGALIITLPKYLEEYKDIVMNIVKQYMLADDYPIIIFEEE